METKWNPQFSTWIAASIFLFLGAVVFVYLIIEGLGSSRADFERFEGPGEVILSLAGPGTYTLYHELSLTADSQAIQRPQGSGHLRYYLMEQVSQHRIELRAAHDQRGYSSGRTVAEPLYEFTIGRPGTYQLTTAYPAEHPGERVQLAVRRAYGSQVIASFTKGLMALVLAWAIAAAFMARDYRQFRTRNAPALALGL